MMQKNDNPQQFALAILTWSVQIKLFVKINPINDAPVVDMLVKAGVEAGTESSIDLDSLVSDVDNLDSEVTVIVSSPDEAGGAQYTGKLAC